jgi:hypothetical protein
VHVDCKEPFVIEGVLLLEDVDVLLDAPIEDVHYVFERLETEGGFLSVAYWVWCAEWGAKNVLRVERRVQCLVCQV